jgi:hypothetical protein
LQTAGEVLDDPFLRQDKLKFGRYEEKKTQAPHARSAIAAPAPAEENHVEAAQKAGPSLRGLRSG